MLKTIKNQRYMALKIFSKDFEQVIKVKANDKILLQRSDNDEVGYATPEQMMNAEGGAIDELRQAIEDEAQTRAEGDIKLAIQIQRDIEGLEESMGEEIGEVMNVVDKQLVARAAYVSNTKKIEFYNRENTKISEIDATAFIKDGMVEDAYLDGDELVIVFNTDAGKEPIEIPLSDIFDPDNYYTKQGVDNLLADKADKAEVDALLEEKADKSTTYTKSETDSLLDAKADKSTTYTKEEVDDIAQDIRDNDIAPISDALDNYYTKRETQYMVEKARAVGDSCFNVVYVDAIDLDEECTLLKSQLLEPWKFYFNTGSDFGKGAGILTNTLYYAFNQLMAFLDTQWKSFNNNDNSFLFRDKIDKHGFEFRVYDTLEQGDKYRGSIRIVPICDTNYRTYSIWIDANLYPTPYRTFRYVRYDVAFEYVTGNPNYIELSNVYRVIYYTQDMQIYFPFDSSLTGESNVNNKTQCGGLYGLIRDGNIGASVNLTLRNGNAFSVFLCYALQIALCPIEERFEPQQIHQVLDILVQTGNSFVRPSKVRFEVASRLVSSNIYYICVNWLQVFTGSGQTSSGNLIMEDVTGVYRIDTTNQQATTYPLSYRNGYISTIVNE